MKITGADELVAALKERTSLDDVIQVVRNNGSGLENTMKRNASFTQGYQTGTTKRSINLRLSDMGFTATVAPTTQYSVYLEYGTRFMSPQPFIRNSLLTQKVKFLSELQRLMK